MNILALDTTSHLLRVGIFREAEWLARRSLSAESHRYHSALMIPVIREMLAEAGLSIEDLEGLALNRGPGGFTGIRTGIVAMRTMAQFLHLPVLTFNTFELLAQNAAVSGPVSIYMDARRGRAYHATLSLTPEGPVYRTPPTLASWPPGGPGEFHDALPLLSESLAETLPPDASLSARCIREDFFSPEAMRLLIARYGGESFQTPWRDVMPLYLQDPSITLSARSGQQGPVEAPDPQPGR